MNPASLRIEDITLNNFQGNIEAMRRAAIRLQQEERTRREAYKRLGKRRHCSYQSKGK